MLWLSLLFGAVVGLSLGLTGGGGAIFAVPLLVYGLGVPAREAVAISLAAVGATSFVGFLHRWKLGEVELRTGLLFAIAGMVGAPVGTWIAGFLPEAVLLVVVCRADDHCRGAAMAAGVPANRSRTSLPDSGSFGSSQLPTRCGRDPDFGFTLRELASRRGCIDWRSLGSLRCGGWVCHRPCLSAF